MSNNNPDKHTDERDTRDARYDHMWLGEVVENSDPLFVGRVRVKVDGIYEPDSQWAWPMGHMLGINNGFFYVPEVGAQVVVFCNQGDVDHPFYMPGPFGAPKGVQDRMPQVPGTAGAVDYMSVRWRGFHITADGTEGAETLTIEDLDTTTKIVIDRASGGDYLRNVEGNEDVEVTGDRNVTVETGDETHTVALGDHTKTVAVGNDTETIGGDKVKTVTGGEIDTITGPAGKVENVLGVAGSVESIPAGLKAITAGLTIAMTAGGAMSLIAGGPVSIVGAGVSVNASAGPTTNIGGGLLTETFLGGVLRTITGAVAETINGALTMTLNGIATFIGTVITLGAGVTPPPLASVGYRNLVTTDFFAAYANIHSHAAPAAPPTQQIVAGNPAQVIPDPTLGAGLIDQRLFSTAHVRAS